MKARYKISCSIAALLSAGAAMAAEQTAAVPDSSGIEEIVVTAQRRTESIQNVPNTIQAFSSRTLEQLNVESVDQLVKYTPNVTFASNGPGAGNIFMRGLSSGFAGNQSSAAVGPFPNVAVYLDDQSMTFPHRNVDVFMVDMERVEVLEGPQGTLFGGGAEAGAVRYITNKPKIDITEGNAEASGGSTAHGDPNYSVNATLNVPLVDGKLAVRGVIYDDHRGGYIDNVPSRFVRKPTDLGPPSYSTVYPANLPVENNSAVAGKAQNPLNYGGARLSALYNVNDDWDILIQQSFQNMEADGMFVQYPTGSDGQKLNPLEVTSFSPVWDKDNFWNTSWTVNGRLGDLKLVYTGAYLHRHIDQTMDYTNYARTAGGFYYQCVGGPASGSNIGAGKPGVCYSAISNWHDIVSSTHQSHEVRAATPDDWRLRGLAGFFYEDLDIRDNMNFQYKSIPSCTPAALAAYQAGGPVCLGNVAPAQGSFANDPTSRGDSVAFGEDQDRGYTQKAFFLSVDYDIIPQVLTVTGGTRYYDYDEGMEGSQYSTGAKCMGLTNGTCYGTPITAATHAASYSGFKSRGNITWHITPDAMVYYTFSQGFRPGAGNRLTGAVTKIDINPATNKPTTGVDNTPTLVNQVLKPYTYAPDSLDNHEVGFKTDFFDKRLILNGSVYYMQWKNVQTLIFNPPVFGNTTFGVNGPDYDIKGFELQYAAKITDGLSSEGSVSYNDAKETNSPCMVSSNNVANNPTALGSCVTQVWSAPTHMNVPIVNPLGAVDATPAFSPKLQFNARVRYDWMMETYGAFMMVGVTHTSSMFNQPSSFPSGEGVTVPTTTYLRFTQPDYTTFDASIGISRDNWHAEIYGQNIGNSHASTFTSTAQFIRSEVPLRPRVVGVKIGSKF